ncbi:hypothetical protein BSQ44_15825 [Aquibium oceanicum]|uniref:Uncharacterized protein n=1 Tax=Aquibium oceanicum TaxID=1670800 RepID=A0A1L3STM7_9HYPH|nr:hypothetical protein BSQ44_15825 [Aquibium oceanicum]
MYQMRTDLSYKGGASRDAAISALALRHSGAAKRNPESRAEDRQDDTPVLRHEPATAADLDSGFRSAAPE